MKRKTCQLHLQKTLIGMALIAAATAPLQAQGEFEGVIAQSVESDFRRSLVRIHLGFRVSGVMLKGRFLPDVQLEEKAEYWGVVIDPRGLIIAHAGGFELFQKDVKNIQAATWRGDDNYWAAELLGIDKRTELVLLHSDEFHNRNLALAEARGASQLFFASYADGHWQIETHPILSMQSEEALPESTFVLNPSRLGNRERLVGSFVLNQDGRLVGLVTRFKEGLSSRHHAVYRIMPSSVLSDSARRIGHTHRTIEAGWLGVVMENTPGDARLFDVFHHSPAEKAGLKKGDVVLKVGGQPLQCLEDLGLAIRWRGPESRLDLTVARAGKIRRLSALLQDRPVEGRIWAINVAEGLPAKQEKPSPAQLSYQKTQLFSLPKLGIVLEPLNAELASKLGLPVQKGLIIRYLSDDSPALHYFRTNDVVIRINDQMICCASELNLALPTSNGRRMMVEYYRDGELQSVEVNAASVRHSKKR